VTIVGVFWQVLLRVTLTRTGPTFPWTMLAREDFPADDGRAAWAAERLLGPSWSPLLPLYLYLQLAHTVMPLVPWLEHALWREPPALTIGTSCALLLA
jgi:hypothetical protein